MVNNKGLQLVTSVSDISKIYSKEFALKLKHFVIFTVRLVGCTVISENTQLLFYLLVELWGCGTILCNAESY